MQSPKWTEDRILSVIVTCPSKKQLKIRYPGAYRSIKHNNWEHLYAELGTSTTEAAEQNNRAAAKWTRETIPALVAQCTSYQEFCQTYPRAYEKIKKKRWFDLLEALPRHRQANDYWTISRLTGLIGDSTSLAEFRQKHRNAYQYIVKHDLTYLLDNLPRISPDIDTLSWSLYRWMFPETHSVYIGISMNVQKRLRDELRYSDASPVKNHIDRTGSSYQITILNTDLSGIEAARQEIATIAQYRNDGYNVLNRNRGGSLGSYTSMLNPAPSLPDLLSEVFTKYSDFDTFKTSDPVLYAAIRRMKAIKVVYQTYFRQQVERLVTEVSSVEMFRKRYSKEYHRLRMYGWTDLLSCLPQREPPPYSELDLVRIAEQVNANQISVSDAATELGVSVVKFYRICNGKLDRTRPRRTRSKKHRIPAGFESALDEMICGHREQRDILCAFGISSYKFTQYANAICPAWKTEWRVNKDKANIDAAIKYTSLADLRNQNPNLYSQIKRHGLYKEVSARMEKKCRPKLTESDVKTAADKCTTLAEFMKEYPTEYQVAHKNRWDHLTSHLTRTYKKTDKFTYEHIWDCAHSCSSRTEFNKKYHSESYAAKKRGIYEEIVADIPKHTWRPQHKAPAPDYVKKSGQ